MRKMLIISSMRRLNRRRSSLKPEPVPVLTFYTLVRPAARDSKRWARPNTSSRRAPDSRQRGFSLFTLTGALLGATNAKPLRGSVAAAGRVAAVGISETAGPALAQRPAKCAQGQPQAVAGRTQASPTSVSLLLWLRQASRVAARAGPIPTVLLIAAALGGRGRQRRQAFNHQAAFDFGGHGDLVAARQLQKEVGIPFAFFGDRGGDFRPVGAQQREGQVAGRAVSDLRPTGDLDPKEGISFALARLRDRRVYRETPELLT